jgi:C-terminal processing protease CtpA/Prc
MNMRLVGIYHGRLFREEIRERMKLREGAATADRERGRFAQEAGLQPGDEIISINGAAPRDVLDCQMSSGFKIAPGASVSMSAGRQRGIRMT